MSWEQIFKDDDATLLKSQRASISGMISGIIGMIAPWANFLTSSHPEVDLRLYLTLGSTFCSLGLFSLFWMNFWMMRTVRKHRAFLTAHPQ